MDRQNSGRGPNTKRIKEGVVMSNKMAKTVTVSVSRTIRHPKFEKVMERRKKYYADCGEQSLEVGQKVRIMECRPLSKLKRWRVVEVL